MIVALGACTPSKTHLEDNQDHCIERNPTDMGVEHNLCLIYRE